MTNLTLDYLVSLFSKPRIYSYLEENDTPLMVLKRYHMNIILSQAMIPVLHYFEILLRNQLDMVLKKNYGEKWLLTLPHSLMISDKDIKKISEIINKIRRERRNEISHDDILSQMTFGFWCAFFHKRYDPVLWHRKNALKNLFPYFSKQNRTRSYIEKNILKIKTIRNRIAHHEPIWKHRASVDEAHKICCEFIQGISPDALVLLSKIDHFPTLCKLNHQSELKTFIIPAQLNQTQKTSTHFE